MCLAIPAKIVKKDGSMATVEVEGIQRDISLRLLPEAKENEYVLMHAGFALEVIDEGEALERWQLLKEVLGLDEDYFKS